MGAFIRIAMTFLEDVRHGDRYALKALWSIIGVLVACLLLILGLSLGGCIGALTAVPEPQDRCPGIVRDSVLSGGLMDSLGAVDTTGRCL